MVLEKDPLISEKLSRPKFARIWTSFDAHSRRAIVLSLILIVFAYLPTLQFNYVTQDQWRAFRYSTAEMTPTFRADACLRMIPSFYVVTGRPLVWESECLEHAVVGRISDFAYLRPLVLLIALATALYLGWVLAPILGSAAVGVMAAAVFIFSPGYAFMFLQGMTGAMVLLSAIFAAASFQTLSPLLDHLLGGKRVSPIRFTAPLAFFLMGCFCYPVWAFLTLALTLIEFGFGRKNTFNIKFQKLAFSIFFYFICSIAYYGSVKLFSSILMKFIGQYHIEQGYRVDMQLDIGTLIARSVQLWKYFYVFIPSNFLTSAGASAAIVSIFSIYVGAKGCTPTLYGFIKAIFKTILCFIVSMIVLMGCASPWLFSRMDTPNSFFMASWYLFFPVAIFGIAHRIVAKSTSRLSVIGIYLLLFVFVIPISVEQNKISYSQALVSDYEIWSMNKGIDQWVSEKGYEKNRYVLVVLPREAYPDFPTRYMFGNADLEGNSVLASSQNPVAVPWMVNAALRRHPDIARSINLINCDFDQNCANYNLLTTGDTVLGMTYGDAPITAVQKPFIIDLSRLTDRPAPLKVQIRPDHAHPSVSASSQFEQYGPQGLPWNIEPGWHAAVPVHYPQSLVVDFHVKKTITRIGFLPQDGLPGRGPRAVQIETSTDGQNWHAASTADLSCSNNSDFHYLSLSSPIETRYVRIVILRNCGDPTLLTLRGLKFE